MFTAGVGIPLEQTIYLNIVGLPVYPFEDQVFPIFKYLLVTDRCRWEFRTAITLLDLSNLNETLLET